MTRFFAGLLLAFGLGTSPSWAATSVMPLSLGFYLPGIRDANPTDVRVSLQLWLEEMGRPYHLATNALMFEDMQELHRAAMEQRVNLIIAPAMELTEAFRPDELMDGFSARRRGGNPGLVLIALKRSGLNNFGDLRGKRVLRLGKDLLSKVFLEVQCQHVAHTACSTLFNVTEEAHDAQSIYKVFFGKADAALVSLSALDAASEMNPQVGERMDVLLDWKVKSMAFGMMSVKSDPDFRALMLRTALKATDTARGRQILELFKTDYMERATVSDLQPFWNLQKEYQDMIRRRK